MSKTNKTPKTAATRIVALPTTSIKPEQAMMVIGEFARERGAGWREALLAFWNGDGDQSALYAARELVPAAILDNLSFDAPKKQRAPKPLSPEQDTARRLRRVGTAMRNQAKSLQRRAKELHSLARELRRKTEPEAAAAILRQMVEGGRLAALETEVGI